MTTQVAKRQLKELTSVNDQLVLRGIRHSMYLERLKVTEVNKVLAFYDRKVLPDLLGQLEGSLKSTQSLRVESTRVKRMIRGISGVLQGGVQQSSGRIRERLLPLALSEAEWQEKVLKDVMPNQIILETVTPNINTIRSVISTKPMRGKVIADHFKDLGLQAKKRVEAQMTIGIVQGESIPQIVRRVREQAGDYARRGIVTLTRTSVNHVSNEARQIVMEENQDVVKGVQYVSTLDDRTTEICMSLDAQVFPINEGPRPPMHHQCRSTVVPVLKSFKELGIDAKEIDAKSRASMNGQVSAKLSYEDWLRQMDSKQSTRHIVDDALGPGKAALWRSGKITVRDLTGPGYKPLSLRELRDKEGLGDKRPPTPPKPKKTEVKIEKTDKGVRIAQRAVKPKPPEKTPSQKAFDELKKLGGEGEAGALQRQDLKQRYEWFLQRAQRHKPGSQSRRLLEDQMKQIKKKLEKPIFAPKPTKAERNKMFGVLRKYAESKPNNVEASWGYGTPGAETGMKWMRAHSTRKGWGDRPYDLEFGEKDFRAHFQDTGPRSGFINVGDGSVKSVIHELGHALENANPANKKAAVRFWEKRTADTKQVSLSKWGMSGEIGNPDKFAETFRKVRGDAGELLDIHAAYTGKVYRRGSKAISDTEIISMGMELMFHNPARFVEHDPDWAMLILKALMGEH